MFEEIVGSSEAIRGVIAQVMRVAQGDCIVEFYTGESGTGRGFNTSRDSQEVA